MPKTVDEVLHGMSAAARKLELSEDTVRDLCDRGVLPAVRDTAGRRLITSGAIRDFLDQRRRAERAKKSEEKGGD